MKTMNNAQKTENRKFRNTLSKTFTLVAGLVLISFTVSANGFRRQMPVNNTCGRMTTLMLVSVNTKTVLHEMPNAAKTLTDNIYSEQAKDKDLIIEDWMINNRYFETNKNAFAEDQDKPLEIENWMIDKQIWGNHHGNN